MFNLCLIIYRPLKQFVNMYVDLLRNFFGFVLKVVYTAINLAFKMFYTLGNLLLVLLL